MNRRPLKRSCGLEKLRAPEGVEILSPPMNFSLYFLGSFDFTLLVLKQGSLTQQNSSVQSQ